LEMGSWTIWLGWPWTVIFLIAASLVQVWVISTWLSFCSETESCYIAQVGVKSVILLPQYRECWDYRYVPLHLAYKCVCVWYFPDRISQTVCLESWSLSFLSTRIIDVSHWHPAYCFYSYKLSFDEFSGFYLCSFK
jgi:hypothetical protein